MEPVHATSVSWMPLDKSHPPLLALSSLHFSMTGVLKKVFESIGMLVLQSVKYNISVKNVSVTTVS